VAVLKIVDAQTGIMRDLAVVSIEKDLVKSAKAIAEFARNSAQAVSKTNPRVFLGVGQFENLGFTNRFGNFGQNLKIALEQAYQGTRVSIVERGSINPLQNELRLNLGGLTDSARQIRSAQPAFLIIDGMFRLVQDDEFKISLLLRVQPIGAKPIQYSFTESPGKVLNHKIIAAINAGLNAMATNAYRATGKDESRVQFAHGKELSGLYSLNSGYAWFGGYGLQSNPGKRHQNISEAIKAFEAALFLDPDYDEAKVCLAICLASPDIEQPDLARNYYYEVFAGSTNETLVEFARIQLVKFYSERNDQPALALLSAEANKNAVLQERKARAARVGKPTGTLPLVDRTAAEQALEARRKRIFADCEEDQSALKIGSAIFTYGRLKNHFDAIYGILNRNTNDARQYIDKLLPNLTEKFPSLELYFLGTYLVWAQEASALNRDRLEHLLDEFATQPQKLHAQETANRAFLQGLTESCVSARLYRMARKSGRLCKSVAQKTASDAVSRLDIYLAYCDREDEQWQKACAGFESLGKLEIQLTIAGPWGKPPFHFRAEQAAYECRQHLGIAGSPPAPAPKPTTEPPLRFSLNPPVLTLSKGFVFRCDGDEIWLADGLLPFVWNKSSEKLREIELPDGIERDITCIAPGQSSVWFGTAGSGLIELDKSTKRTKLYREGLLLPNITALLLTDQRLWLGYGKGEEGGLGYLDLSKRKFYGMTPALDSKSVLPFPFSVPKTFVQNPFEIPPKERVVGIVQTSSEEIWLATQGLGIRRYSFISNCWNLRGDEWNNLNDGKISGRTLRLLALTPDYLIYGGHDYGGNLGIYDRKRKQTRLVALQEWLPEGVFNGYRFKGFLSIALEGDHVWAGGEGFLALIDLASTRVEKLCDLRDGHIRVHGLQIDGGDLWVAAENKLIRLSKTTAYSAR